MYRFDVILRWQIHCINVPGVCTGYALAGRPVGSQESAVMLGEVAFDAHQIYVNMTNQCHRKFCR